MEQLSPDWEGPARLSPFATTTEARAPRAPAPQQEKPPQWESSSPQLEKAHTGTKVLGSQDKQITYMRKESGKGYTYN